MAPQRFEYRNGAVLFNALRALGFSLIWNATLAYILFSAPFAWPAVAAGVVFGSAGAALFAYGTARLLSFFNESILISEGEIVWTDWRSREALRAKVTDLIRGSLSTGSIQTGVGTEQYGRSYSVDTLRGQIHFSSSITDAPQLIKTLTDLTGEPQPRGIFTYRSPLLAIVPIIFIPAILAATSSMTVAAFTTGVPMKINGRPSGMMPWYAVVGMDLAFWAFLIPIGAMALAFWNERITVTNAEVIWRDRYGQERVRVPLSDVEYGHVRRLTYNNGGSVYVVPTRAGDIRFSNALKDADSLAQMFDRPSHESKEPDPWMNDPLHQLGTTATGSSRNQPDTEAPAP